MEIKLQKKKYVKGLSRRLFSKSDIVFPECSLLSIQKDSYYSFIGDSHNEGRLSLALKKFFPLRNAAQTVELRYISCRVGECRYSIDDCIKKELTYSSPIFATFQIVATVNEKQVVREQEMYMGEMPIMTDGGSFVVNGVERVIVSQIHRSPGVIFGHDSAKSHSSGRKLYYCKIIPYRGSWLDFEFDYKGVIHSKIDKKRKLPATTILLALNGLVSRSDLQRIGISDDVLDLVASNRSSKKNVKEVEDRVEIDRSCLLRIFYHVKRVKLSQKSLTLNGNFASILGYTFDSDVINLDTNSALFYKGYVVDQATVDRISNDFPNVCVNHDFIIGGAFVSNIIDKSTGEVLFAAGSTISQGALDILLSNGIHEIEVILPQEINISPYILDTMSYDKNLNSVEALFDVYRAVRPGDSPSPEGARTFFQSLFFDAYKYDLSPVGRVRINERLGIDLPENESVLNPSDIFASVFKLIEIKNGKGYIDDIDSLLCRRVRSVGELFENQCYISFSRVERSMIDMINSADPATVMPSDLVGVRFLDAPIRDCILLNQLSQFMDQTNPLSEISHKRRISALGPGALSRERSGFEVRDISPTQYGRICPIETPEGSNLGIVSALSLYARVNKYGFIETPYYVVQDGTITGEIVYLSASQEMGHKIAQYTDRVGDKIRSDDLVIVRCDGKYLFVPANEVTLCDISASQAFSVATAMIPLMEQNEAHRALMGANMQRQAVPLVNPDAPLVGTGWEGYVARESGSAIVAKSNGVIVRVDSKAICVQPDDSCNLEIYHLKKYSRSNAGTCANQRPIVSIGDVVKKGDILSDGPCIQNGEVALGKDVKVAFLSFFGKNFEDSVVVSEKVAADYTSVHLMEVICKVMDSKGITEDISRSIPNVNPEKIMHLDEFGLPCIGSKVSAGDILVGKISRNIYDYRMSPEDKLLRSIFGDIALNVKDVSSKVPIGVKNATVVDVEILTKRGIEKDAFVTLVERSKIEQLSKEFDLKKKFLFDSLRKILLSILSGARKFVKNKSISDIDFEKFINSANEEDLFLVSSVDEYNEKLLSTMKFYRKSYDDLISRFEDQKANVVRGDDLPSGVIKMIKVTLAIKRPLRAGDKMAGRHGNKGVVSCVLPIEDMPFMEDGTPIDVVLTPAGVPSRMNVGQISETVLAWGLYKLGSMVVDHLVEVQNSNVSDESINKLRVFLKSIYSENIIKQGNFIKNFDIDSLSIEELLHFANGLTRGIHVASCIFDGASEEDVFNVLSLAGLEKTGKYDLYDGRTGEKFDRPVTVGIMHYLKLHHLVDEKIHARAIGPYSLVTQQPLGGKAQFGGQRLGEMEVWSLEAYGAAHILKEMLTIKSDASDARVKAYQSIIWGDMNQDMHAVPASFEVLIQEIRALCIAVDLQKSGVDFVESEDEDVIDAIDFGSSDLLDFVDAYSDDDSRSVSDDVDVFHDVAIDEEV